MFEQLKKMAIDKLQESMAGNSLNNDSTSEAAQEGAESLMSSLKDKLSLGSLDEIKDLFSNGGKSLQENSIFKDVQAKIQGVLQGKGMDASEAMEEAKNVAPNLINGLKDKFMSGDDADKSFDLGMIGDLAGGKAADLLNKAKGFFG